MHQLHSVSVLCMFQRSYTYSLGVGTGKNLEKSLKWGQVPGKQEKEAGWVVMREGNGHSERICPGSLFTQVMNCRSEF